MKLKVQTSGPDKLLIILPIILTLAGVLMVTNASVVQAQTLFGDKFFFAKQQLAWAGLGALGFLVASQIPYKFWSRVATPLFWLTVALLVAVLLPAIGTAALGARRWINLGSFSFQPAEIAKLVTILYLSKLLSKNGSIVTFFFSVALVCGLVIAEPDLGTSIVIAATSVSLLFFSGVPTISFLIILPLLAALASLLIIISPYRKERLLSFIAGAFDPLQASYHTKQVLLALASGGLFGVGLGQSRQKFLFLPEAATDSIFAIIAEEGGFFGSLLFILAFVVLVAKILQIARNTVDPFAKLVAAGVGVWIGVQAFINIGAMTATLPLTGIPLPFFSYGGSSLFVTLFALGIILNISKERTIKR